MQLFFVSDWSDNGAELSSEESRHCVQVLRKKVGDEIIGVDGKGHLLTMRIREVSKKQVGAEVLRVQENWNALPYQFHLLVAPTKNADRLEWLLEKATEVGISRITPVICQRSERKTLRLDRLEKVLLAAMKQSLKGYLPQLDEPMRFKDCLIDPDFKGSSFIAHCAEGEKHTFAKTILPEPTLRY